MNTPTTQPVRRVVIAGGGTAGWMMAALMSKLLGRQLDIKLVESEEIGTVGVGEATIPALHTFHNLLGINEAEFMAATNATFKLGIHFEGWKDIGEDYFHSFGSTGNDHWSAGFQHFWLKGVAEGLARPYTDYNPETVAAFANRFAHLPRNGLNYAYHLDAGRYARYLRAMSEAHGVQRIEGRIAALTQIGQHRIRIHEQRQHIGPGVEIAILRVRLRMQACPEIAHQARQQTKARRQACHPFQAQQRPRPQHRDAQVAAGVEQLLAAAAHVAPVRRHGGFELRFGLTLGRLRQLKKGVVVLQVGPAGRGFIR